MPSVNSRSMPNVWPSSTLTTPSLPTFSIASAITSPISSSPAEIVATRAICSLPEISVDCVSVWLATASTPSSSALRASASYFSSLCAISVLVLLGLDLGQHVGLAEDEELLAVHLDLGAAVLAVEDLVAFGDVERRALAGVLVDLAV